MSNFYHYNSVQYHKKCLINFVLEPHRLVYTVIATDYTEYVVGYNCNTKRKTRK